MKSSQPPRQIPLIPPGVDPLAQAQLAAAGRAQAQMLQANALRSWGRMTAPIEPVPVSEPSGAQVFRRSLPAFLSRQAEKAAAEGPPSDELLRAAREALDEADASLAAADAAASVDELRLDERWSDDDLPLIDPDLIQAHDPSEDLPGIFPPRNPAA